MNEIKDLSNEDIKKRLELTIIFESLQFSNQGMHI